MMRVGIQIDSLIQMKKSRAKRAVLLFSGGGSGGHIVPNLAVLERLDPQVTVGHFLVSTRPMDQLVLAEANVPYTALPVQPLTRKFAMWPQWLANWRASVRQVSNLIETSTVTAVVSTGGFVSGPVLVAAARSATPVALMNLDAVPGRANRTLARRATQIFSAYETPVWPNAIRIGLPLRKSAIGPADKAAARSEFGLDSGKPTLLVCGGSQGARSINNMVEQLLNCNWPCPTWQVLHLTGSADDRRMRQAYDSVGVAAVVIAYCHQMGSAWASADLAISRAGANSVAEAHANGVPTIFMPYPHHRDQHQRLNAKPLAECGGAIVAEDLINPEANAAQMRPLLRETCEDPARRHRMTTALQKARFEDGAAAVAQWIRRIASH